MNENGVFLADSPYMLIKKKQINDVPWIVGVTDQEGQFASASKATKNNNICNLMS